MINQSLFNQQRTGDVNYFNKGMSEENTHVELLQHDDIIVTDQAKKQAGKAFTETTARD